MTAGGVMVTFELAGGARRRPRLLRVAAAGPAGPVARRARDARVAPGDDRRPPHAGRAGRPAASPTGSCACRSASSTATTSRPTSPRPWTRRALPDPRRLHRPAAHRQPAGGLPRRRARCPRTIRQDLAREIGFSETVFCDPPSHPTAGDVRARIFTPGGRAAVRRPPRARHRGGRRPRAGAAGRVGRDPRVRRRPGARRARRRRHRRVDAPADPDGRAVEATSTTCSPPSASTRRVAPGRGLRQRPDPHRRRRRRRVGPSRAAAPTCGGSPPWPARRARRCAPSPAPAR